MKIEKQGTPISGGTPNEAQLAQVNLQCKRPMKAEEVYVFAVRLCDDQVDRDFERFDTGALAELGRMFVGKPGIVDHNWSAEKQVARIFDTEVVSEGGVHWLKAWAYMPREGREELIADIESGIRKEVSISCSMKRKECSICGGEMGLCGHGAGRSYDGEICVGILKEPQDAYEFSFVAVPAQPKAGVVKHWKGGEAEMSLKDYVESSGMEGLKNELKKLKKLAEYGEAKRLETEKEVARMGVALELGLGKQAMEQLARELEDDTLEKLYEGLKKKMAQWHCGKPQLESSQETENDRDLYLI